MSIARAAARPPAVAGRFYPDDPEMLAAAVDSYLADAPDHGLRPRAVIVPHAGYRYSAPVAAAAYAGLRRLRSQVRRVVLVGPAHKVAVHGLALPAADAFATPLDPVPVDADTRRRLSDLPHVVTSDEAHACEHSLEVQLPFLRRVLGDFAVVPLAVGRATAQEVADVIERCWVEPDTLVVVSSDLSHYLDEARACRLDATTTVAIEELRPEALRRRSACGVIAIAGLLLAARRRGMRAVTLDVRTSADTAGSPERVVGYGSWAFLDDLLPPLSPAEGARLVELARATVVYGVRGGLPGGVRTGMFPARFQRRQAAFVALSQGGRPRGCVGGAEATHPLAVAVTRAAHRAAFSDARFDALDASELSRTFLSLSVLSPLERILVGAPEELAAALRPGRDGLVLIDGPQRGVFLPDVWDAVAGPGEFVARLRRKAGLSARPWGPTTAAYRFETQRLS